MLFEALISPDHRGYMGLDDILLLSYPCGESQPTMGAGVWAAAALACKGLRLSSCHYSISPAKAPHFSRLGDVEVNAGQNASFQCMAAGRAAEAERFLLQVRRAQPGLGVRGCVSFLRLSPSFSPQHRC